MPIVILLIVAITLALVLLPQVWVRSAMKKHADHRPDFPGTGGELARHLLDEAGLNHVKVEMGQDGQDHFDPSVPIVRLSPMNYEGKSVTAVAVAAHEVGHAMQHAEGDKLLDLRIRLAGMFYTIDMMATFVLFAGPILAVLLKAPILILLKFAVIIGLLFSRVVVHALTLPVEFDASFKRALPTLEKGGYLHKDDMPAARHVLKAAAYTYVAAALMSLLNMARLLRILRF